METREQINIEIQKFKENLAFYKSKNLRLFASSSFQTHSIPMLAILSQLAPEVPVYFLNTGFHFVETFQYRDEITKLLNLNTKSVSSSINKKQQLNMSGQFNYVNDQDHCCYMNKVVPMDSLLNIYDVWINGIRKNQSEQRAAMKVEEKASEHALRYHPMLDWSEKMIWKYIYDHNIPFHPLDLEGYNSIGCEPCTSKSNLEIGRDKNRNGRWEGIQKKECGLHINLVVKE